MCVTGQIASGKSTVCTYLRNKGALYISADAISHSLLGSGSSSSDELKTRLACAFGEDVLTEGEINRVLLASRAFADTASKELLETIELPYIEAELQSRLHEAQKTGAQCVVIEVPLIEKVCTLTDACNEVLCVVAPVSLIQARAHKRNTTAFDSNIHAINPQAEKNCKDHFQYLPEVYARMVLSSTIIYNAGTHAMLTRHLDAWWNARISHETHYPMKEAV